MKVIMPVAGSSSRFPGTKPKWLLTHPNGNLMFHEALAGLDLKGVDEVLVVCRKDHHERFGAAEIFRRQRAVSPLKTPMRLLVVAPTRSQPETVAVALRAARVKGPFLIKDCDNRFRCPVRPGNAVATANLGELPSVSAGGKSYVKLDAKGRLGAIVEKEVVSGLCCVGGYSFADAGEFLEAYGALKDSPDLYVSHLIGKMLSGGAVFKNTPVTGYQDWGTLKEWNRYKKEFATLFVDLDGTIVKSSAYFFPPYWGGTPAIPGAVEALNKLHDSGRVQVIVTTSRRPDARKATEAQLKRIGLRCDRVVYGLQHSKRVVINDFAPTNPYRSAAAVNIPRDQPGLPALLADLFEDLG
ncbi:MAG: hypothetical protein HY928_00530 [Elusimicrobia bacterium]|nr:hypothetical protein [Elusimicrobiota bacterium]